MEAHPSLSAQFIEPEPIRPVEAMGPYEPCWCMSGKKYKWCHHRREQEKPINIFEVESGMLAELRAGYCSHPDPSDDPCSTTITRAHTVQRRGGLAAIAEDGHVLTVKPTMKSMIETQGNPAPRKIGVGNASVFPGFCSKHDTTIFKPIEGKTVTIDASTAFLFAYRAIAYERFAKEAQLRSAPIQAEMDRGKPFRTQVQIQSYLNSVLAGIKIGMDDVNRWKAGYDERLMSGSRDGFRYFAIRFDSVLPIVACCAFHPEIDFHGNQLQRLARRGSEFEHITLTVTAFESETIAVFGWIGPNDGPAALLARSFSGLTADRKADALIKLLFLQSDNIFLRQSWWNGLTDQNQKLLEGLSKSGTAERTRKVSDLSDDGTTFTTARAVEVISSEQMDSEAGPPKASA